MVKKKKSKFLAIYYCDRFCQGASLLLLERYNTTWSYNTYSVLYAAGSLSKQLWLGVLHLRGVENLLAVNLVQVQETTELHGG